MLGSTLLSSLLSIWAQSRKAKAEAVRLAKEQAEHGEGEIDDESDCFKRYVMEERARAMATARQILAERAKSQML